MPIISYGNRVELGDVDSPPLSFDKFGGVGGTGATAAEAAAISANTIANGLDAAHRANLDIHLPAVVQNPMTGTGEAATPLSVAVSATVGNALGLNPDGLFVAPGSIPLADAVSPAADDATGDIGTSTEVAKEDHKHPAQGVSNNANNSIAPGTDGLHYFRHFEEVEVQTGDLTGTAVPLGKRIGIDDATGQFYYPLAGNWAPVPVATVDLNTTVSQETGSTALAAPISPPASPDTSDLHVETYANAVVYWTWNSTVWVNSAEFPLPAIFVEDESGASVAGRPIFTVIQHTNGVDVSLKITAPNGSERVI